jgi:hypothetical protein
LRKIPWEHHHQSQGLLGTKFLRKDDAKSVTLKKDAKYPLVILEILYGVIIDEDMLGKVLQLKYVDHDITDTMKFLKLALSEYLELKIDPLMKPNYTYAKGMGQRVGMS